MFEEKDYLTLAMLAREENVSVGEWLRDAAKIKAAKAKIDLVRGRQKAIDEIMTWRSKVGVRATKEEILAWVREGRKYEDGS